MVRYEASVRIEAPLGEVWSVLSNVEKWPQWLPTVLDVAPLDAPALRAGARFQVTHPRFSTAAWRVTMSEPAYGFSWESRSPGARVVAEHLLASQRDGATMVVLRLSFDGMVGKWRGRFKRATSERYLCLKACALKEAVELEHAVAT